MGSKNVKVISRDSSTQAQWNQWTCFVRMYILGPSWPDGDPSADCLATGEPGEPGEPGKVSLKTKHNIARPNNPIPWKHLKTENFSHSVSTDLKSMNNRIKKAAPPRNHEQKTEFEMWVSYTLDSLYQCYTNADTMASPHIQYLYHTFMSNLCLTAEEQNGIFHLGFQERVLCLEEAPQPTYGSIRKHLLHSSHKTHKTNPDISQRHFIYSIQTSNILLYHYRVKEKPYRPTLILYIPQLLYVHCMNTSNNDWTRLNLLMFVNHTM